MNWAIGEAYPAMNNILELCKIFHCHINDLVNDNILDLDSLDEDVKMSAVKFKKEKQKQMKGISKVLSLIGKIGGIVLRLALVFVIIGAIMTPVAFNYIDVKDGKLVSNTENILALEKGESTELRLNDSTVVVDFKTTAADGVARTIENHSKGFVLVLFEIGLAILIGFIVVLIRLLKHLELLFSNINKGDTPFTLENVKHIKMITYLMIACIILSGFGETTFDFIASSDAEFGLELFDIVEILFLYSMSLIFEYGYEIQLDSKGRIYGDENE